MEKNCIICNNISKYKCPTCLIYYCSILCSKKHHEQGCNIINKQQINNNLSSNNENQINYRFPSADTIPYEKLVLLKNDETLKELLSNPHLRSLLITIDKCDNPEKVLQKAMQEPLFIEFAETCLKNVENYNDDNDN